MSQPTTYRFSFGPWNISEGSDPFGPNVREPYSLVEKLDQYRPLGFEAVQFHDDDVVPDLDALSPAERIARARDVRRILDDRGLEAEFIAPRLWFSPQTIDGAFTSNDERDRTYAIERTMQAVEIGREIGTTNVVLWLAREGTYIREAKDTRVAVDRILSAVNRLLAEDPELNVWIEPKPNEPMDHAYIPTIGHAIALACRSDDPDRVSGVIETAHAILAGLDPADEMAFALSHGKLASVHLNDQNGLKYDQDKAFGSVNLRSAFNQVRVLEDHSYGRRGEFVGLDVKAMRTQPRGSSMRHLANSRATFLHLVEKVRSLDREEERRYIEARDYEGLDAFILRHLMGVETGIYTGIDGQSRDYALGI